ncbi:MAG: hypothetical protein ABI689_00890 [Thermoanaerobaculia bacterium]
MRPGCWLVLLIALLSSSPSRGELIYAATGNEQGWQLFWFDSEAPGTPLGSLPLFGDFDDYIQFRIEFDPWTHELYAFGYPNCQITCPPSPIDPARIDLATGEMTLLNWPEFPSGWLSLHDIRIDPQTREVRAIGYQGRNYRYSLNSLELHEDVDLNTPGWYVALAHTPAGGEHGGETLAIRHQTSVGPAGLLARIGGVGGDPSASSGQVTLLGEILGPYFVSGFDIAVNGSAYLLGAVGPYGPQHLFGLDLATLETQDFGLIVPPSGSDYIMGIAAAPPGFGQSVVEVPALSKLGLVVLTILLAGVALRRWKVG